MAESLVKGSGCGTREWREDFKLEDASKGSILKVPQAGTGETVLNDAGNDLDLRVESDTNANAIFVDASTDRVGIFTAAPSVPFEVTGNAKVTGTLGVTGATTFGDGTVGAPAISFTSDPDTGLYRIGANDLGVAAAGAKVLDVSATGLDVTGTVTSSGNIAVTNAAPSLALTDSTGAAKSLTVAVDANLAQLRESAGAAGSLLVLDLANNRVGVATAAPAVALDVTGACNISGTFTPAGSVVRTSQKRAFTSNFKVGATAGWVVNAATNTGNQATQAAGSTNATLVIPLNLKVGDTITAYSVSGFGTSAGNTATLNAALRSLTPASGSFTDAQVAAGGTISITGNALINAGTSGNGATGLSTVVAAEVQYYILVTSTTAASTTFGLCSAQVVVTEA